MSNITDMSFQYFTNILKSEKLESKWLQLYLYNIGNIIYISYVT